MAISMKKRYILCSLCLILIFYVLFNLYSNRYLLEVTEYTLTSEKLPEAFDGYRIVQLSDLHAAEFGLDNQNLVEQVSALSPDLIAITGDFIQCEEEIPVTETLVKRLTAIAPVYVCSGNHDWACGAALELRSAITDAGGHWLGNDCCVLSQKGQSIILAGVEDPNSYADMIRPDQLMNLIADAYPNSFTILLAHRNDWPERYPTLKADLILCGHGHGGIVRLPGLGGLLGTDHQLFPEYDAGMFPCGRYTMLVSRGLGNSHWVPRFWNRPEIVCLTLRSN